MKRTFLVKKDPTIEAQDNWLIMDYRQYAAWRETDEGKNREIVFGKFEACSEDDSIIFMECNEKVSKELKKDCHRKQYIRSRDAETPFQVMSYSTMTFQESEIYGEDVLEDTETDAEELVVFGEDILEAVKLLTRPEGADEAKYVAKILQNPIARVVKNADKICNLWDAMYEGTPGEKRTKKVRSFAEKYIKKSEDFYKGRFSKALDDSIERAHILLSEDIVSERQYPSYSREEMIF